MTRESRFTDEEMIAGVITTVVLGVLGTIGFLYHQHAQQNIETEKAKVEAVRLLVDGGARPEEVNRLLAAWSGHGNLSPRAELAIKLKDRGIDSSRIPDIVRACHGEDDPKKTEVIGQ